MKPLTPEALEIVRMFSNLDDEDQELVARLIDFSAAARPSVRDEAGRMLKALPKDLTREALRASAEAVIAYLEQCGREH
jgi:hypothetical protein